MAPSHPNYASSNNPLRGDGRILGSPFFWPCTVQSSAGDQISLYIIDLLRLPDCEVTMGEQSVQHHNVEAAQRKTLENGRIESLAPL